MTNADKGSSIPLNTWRRESDASTHLIPSPGSQGKAFKRYEPLLSNFVVIIGVPVFMLALGIGLEIVIFISNKNDGFVVPQSNVFTGVSPDFLVSFFPTLLVIPFAIAWRVLDGYLRQYQPYIVLNEGNAKAEESLLLDYITIGRPQTLFRAFSYNHQLVFWSSVTAVLTYIYQPLAGSILHIQQRPRTSGQTDSPSISIYLYQARKRLVFQRISPILRLLLLLPAMSIPLFFSIFQTHRLFRRATATFEVPSNDQYLNGSMTTETSGIQTEVTCSNPPEPPTLSPVGTTNFSLSSTSVDGCVNSVSINSTVATNQYGVTDVLCPGNVSTLASSLRPVMFWFFQAQDDGNTPQVQTVFCAPTIQAHYIKVVANLNNGSLTDVSATGNFLPQNNVTGVGGALNGSAFNGLIFDNITNPFIEARANVVRTLIPEAIFNSAELLSTSSQSAFDLPNAFLGTTTKLYTRYLSVSALSIYFLQTDSTLPAAVVSLIQTLKVSPVPAHILAITLILTGIVGIFIQLISRQQRKQLLLAAPPGSIASAIALTSRSGFGVCLVPYDDELSLKEKLDGLRFRLDKRTGAILADEIETDKSGRPGSDDVSPLLSNNTTSRTGTY